MIIFSDDYYFILGLTVLFKNKQMNQQDNFIVFDGGRKNIFVIDVTTVDNDLITDPFLFFLFCYRFRAPRGESVSRMAKIINGRRCLSIQAKKSKTLTVHEMIVIKEIGNGISQKKIALKLKLSEKTISSQKTNALRKLNLSKGNDFFSEYFSWLPLWREYIKFMKSSG